MAHGEHIHEWQYNDARHALINRVMKYLVTRFCKVCFIVQEIHLNEEAN